MADFESKYTGEEAESLLDKMAGLTDEDGYVYSAGEKVDMRFTRSLIPVGTSIPANANLNSKTYLKIGKYYCRLNVDAKTITNCPTSEAFSMEVFNPLGTNVDDEDTEDYTYRLRILTAYKTGVQYIQYCNTSGTAGSWTYNGWFVVPRTSFSLASNKNGGTAAKGASNRGVYIDSTGTFQQMSYTVAKSVPSNAVFTDTNTKVTSVDNHYAPAEDESQQIDAPSGEVVTGIKRDAAGHVVGVVSAPQTGGGGGESVDNFYYTDFKVQDLELLVSGHLESLQIDGQGLMDAIYNGKTISVPYGEDVIGGAAILLGEVVDTDICFSVYTHQALVFYCEAVQDVIYGWGVSVGDLTAETVKAERVGDLVNVAVGDGLMSSASGRVYALPDAATGDEDDILLSRDSVKTINGQDLFVDENSNDIITTYQRITTNLSSVELLPNTVTEWLSPITFQDFVLTLADTHDQGYAAEYIAVFSVGADGVQLIVPDNVVWADGILPAMANGKTYEISFVDNLATFLEF